MKKSEMAKLLGVAALVDNRVVTAEVVEAWHEAIGDLSYEQARRALAVHRRESTEYLQPAHLWALARTPYEEPDITDEVVAESKARALAAAGVTEDEFNANQHDPEWIRRRFATQQITATADEGGDPE